MNELEKKTTLLPLFHGQLWDWDLRISLCIFFAAVWWPKA